MSVLEGKKILIVEDDSLLSELLAKKFFEEKAGVEHASDGEVSKRLHEEVFVTRLEVAIG